MSSDYKYIVMQGNPFDGYTFHGVFDDVEEANEWGDINYGWEWYTVRINPVENRDHEWSGNSKEIVKDRSDG